jgi:hypothetical protein
MTRLIPYDLFISRRVAFAYRDGSHTVHFVSRFSCPILPHRTQSAVRSAALCRTRGQDFVRVRFDEANLAKTHPNDEFRSDEDAGFITPSAHVYQVRFRKRGGRQIVSTLRGTGITGVKTLHCFYEKPARSWKRRMTANVSASHKPCGSDTTFTSRLGPRMPKRLRLRTCSMFSPGCSFQRRRLLAIVRGWPPFCRTM